jgi:pimeloyl-ACP methyl ester carboxylesterase
MKHLLLLPFLALCLNVFCQTKTTIYCFHGQGSTGKIFGDLRVDSSYIIQLVEYSTPEKGMTMQSFAKALATQIDTTAPFILLGVSLGGMLCTELSEWLHPRQTIIISSAKNRGELPFRYRFQKTIPLYKLFPGKLLVLGAKILQPIVEPDRRKNKETFKEMLASKNGSYMKRTIQLVINWERTSNTHKIYHLHGNNDHTLPYRNIKTPDFTVNNGSHMMTLTRAEHISAVLNGILKTAPK